MVHRKTCKRPAVKKKGKTKKIILLFLLGILTALIVVGVGFLIRNFIQNQPIPEEEVKIDEPVVIEEEEKEVLPERIDFQPLVDEWVASVTGNRSVLIYDLERDEMVGSYNPDESYNTASLYKLFVVYEGYRRIQDGRWDANEMAGSTGYNILDCLNLAIRSSYSPCAETLWAYIGHDELDEIIETDFGISDSDISSLLSNPNDILEIMKIFYYHPEIRDANLVATMKDSFLNQPVTSYNWRQGLPSGFTRANVYNKVGWDYNPEGGYWNIYHDAAIVEFPEDERHFIVVVMTKRVPYQQITRFGQMIEAEYYNE